jgi:hypothetical protein
MKKALISFIAVLLFAGVAQGGIFGGGGGGGAVSHNQSAATDWQFGAVSIGDTSLSNESAPLGSELASSGWSSDASWTGTFASGFTHTAGTATNLANTLAAVSGQRYQIAYTVTNYVAGYFYITFGGQTSPNIVGTGSWGPTASSTATLAVVPTSNFNGTITLSVKQITGTFPPVCSILNDAGTSIFEIRSGGVNPTAVNTFLGEGVGGYATAANENVGVGWLALRNLTTGYYNTALGVGALEYNTFSYQNTAIGSNTLQVSNSPNNTAVGYNAGFSNTTGSITAVGASALHSNTTGTGNVALGTNAVGAITTGDGDTAIGYSALSSDTSGNNTAVGYLSLYQAVYGSNTAIGNSSGSSLTTGQKNTFVGYYTQPQANTDNYEIAIGYNVTGNGSSTTQIGSSTITRTGLGPLQFFSPGAFSGLPACASTYEGSTAAVTDSTTNTWGATITGGGSNHVLGYCDGIQWSVMAK